MTIINVHSNILVYNDSSDVTNNPKRRYVDWTRHLQGVEVTNPLSQAFRIPPGQTVNAFSGTRVLVNNSNNRYSMALRSDSSNIYRLGWTGPSDPGFVTTRTLSSIISSDVTVTINNNITITFANDTITFTTVQIGDKLFIPGVSTGDAAGPFSISNEGDWIVLAISSDKKSLTLQRPSGVTFQAVAETVTMVSNGDFLVYAENNIQVGDTLDIVGGFSSITRHPFVISRVHPLYLEFPSAAPLPLESDVVLSASDWTVYSAAKRFVHVEVDQDALVALNDDTSQAGRLNPISTGDVNQTAILQKWGTVWCLNITNRSQTTVLNATVLSVE